MDISIEKAAECSLGSLFQQIINDMKNSSPLWEDFIIKATKLHACLRAAIQAISSYLEAFQKIADAATNSKGASKEIGTALTRVCLRHKAVETRMKTFTTAIMDSLIIPLQDKLEEWKRQVVILDKDHTKEYKRCRNELKKRSSDTLRLQKKAKKGTSDNLQSLVDSSMQTVNQQKAELDEVERKSLRMAMIEDRMRYCNFVNMLQPVVKQEYEMMYELGHLQEAMQTVTNVTKEPTVLPQASEELIAESKTSYNLYPDSPTHSSSQGCSNSLGSRKSSVCSISSMNSSGSSGSPGHQFQRSLSQYNPAIRLKPGESSDSGFCSSPALTSQVSTATSQSHAVSTWPPPGAQEAVSNADRPHTISTAYERGHQRPALTVYTFQNPGETITESTSQKSPATSLSCRPPLPIRCSSLERPLSATSNSRNSNASNTSNAARQCPSPIPAHVAKEHPTLNQPTYVNMTELASMAAYKNTNSNNSCSNNTTTTTTQQPLVQPNSPALSSTSSLVSPDSSATNPISSPEGAQTPQNTPLTSSPLMVQGAASITTSTATLVDDINHDDLSTSTTPTNQAPVDNNAKCTVEPSLENRDSPIDTKSCGSVLDKASMFEKKLEEQQPLATAPTHHPITLPINNTLNLTPATVARLESIYGKKTEEIYNKTAGLLVDRVDAGVSRIARRSSVNTVKPPPPVRRSSSVTPSHHGDTNNTQNNLLQHQQFNVSSESLPPPPAYLLDRNHQPHVMTNANSHYMTSSTSMGQMPSSLSSHNVQSTGKTLNDLRHSPGVMRRQLSLISNHHPSSNHSQNSHTITYASQPSTPKLEKEGNTSMFSIYGATTGNGTTGYTSNDIFGTMPRQVKSQPGIYAQPKQVASVSSFRTSSPNPPPKSTGLLAQLTARITPNKSQNQPTPQTQQHQQQQQAQQNDYDRSRNEPIYQRRGSNQSNQYYDTQSIYGQQQQQQQNDGKNQIYSQSPHQAYQQQQHQYNVYNQNIYVSTNPFISPPTNNYSPSSFGKDVTANYSNYQTTNYSEKNESSVLAKAAPGFLDNLNQKLAEQRASNKAFQVRSYINSKVVPDPRIVRESLMDQIKRGANLKQTRDGE